MTPGGNYLLNAHLYISKVLTFGQVWNSLPDRFQSLYHLNRCRYFNPSGFHRIRSLNYIPFKLSFNTSWEWEEHLYFVIISLYLLKSSSLTTSHISVVASAWFSSPPFLCQFYSSIQPSLPQTTQGLKRSFKLSIMWTKKTRVSLVDPINQQFTINNQKQAFCFRATLAINFNYHSIEFNKIKY